jgi:hypothetical protein
VHVSVKKHQHLWQWMLSMQKTFANFVQLFVTNAPKSAICSKMTTAKSVRTNAVNVLMNAEKWLECNLPNNQ